PATRSTLFPYTTLFRSRAPARKDSVAAARTGLHDAEAAHGLGFPRPPRRDRSRRDPPPPARLLRRSSPDRAGDAPTGSVAARWRSEEHTSELQSRRELV